MWDVWRRRVIEPNASHNTIPQNWRNKPHTTTIEVHVSLQKQNETRIERKNRKQKKSALLQPKNKASLLFVTCLMHFASHMDKKIEATNKAKEKMMLARDAFPPGVGAGVSVGTKTQKLLEASHEVFVGVVVPAAAGIAIVLVTAAPVQLVVIAETVCVRVPFVKMVNTVPLVASQAPVS